MAGTDNCSQQQPENWTHLKVRLKFLTRSPNWNREERRSGEIIMSGLQGVSLRRGMENAAGQIERSKPSSMWLNHKYRRMAIHFKPAKILRTLSAAKCLDAPLLAWQNEFNEISRGCTAAATEVPLTSVLTGSKKKSPSSTSNWEISPWNIAAMWYEWANCNDLSQHGYRHPYARASRFLLGGCGQDAPDDAVLLFPKSKKEIRVISQSCFFPGRRYAGATKEGFYSAPRLTFFLYFHSCTHVCDCDNYEDDRFTLGSHSSARLGQNGRRDERPRGEKKNPQRKRRSLCVWGGRERLSIFTWQKFISGLWSGEYPCLKKTHWGRGSWLCMCAGVWVCVFNGGEKQSGRGEDKALIISLSRKSPRLISPAWFSFTTCLIAAEWWGPATPALIKFDNESLR